MNKKDRTKFQKILLHQKKEVLNHLNDLSGLSEDEDPIASGDAADIANTEIAQTAMSKIGKREKMLLKKIDYALQKIEEGSYGECENCGEDIDLKRLEARPVALLCIDCKTEQENMESKFANQEEESDFVDDDDDMDYSEAE